MEKTERLGHRPFAPDPRAMGDDSSIISEAAPSELAADHGEPQRPAGKGGRAGAGVAHEVLRGGAVQSPSATMMPPAARPRSSR